MRPVFPNRKFIRTIYVEEIKIIENMAKEINKEKERTEAVVDAVSKTDLFFSENKKTIIAVVCVLIVVCAGIFLYHKYGYLPARQEAMEQMFPAEENFRNGEYELALNGDGNVLGFAQVIENYGAKAGQAVYFYAGICEIELENWQEAIDYLSAYKGKDKILKARAYCCIGDAYTGLNNYEKAVEYFEKAAGVIDNIYAATYILKAGITYEALGNNAKALESYQTIKDRYPMTIEGYEIDKYISRIETKINE